MRGVREVWSESLWEVWGEGGVGGVREVWNVSVSMLLHLC